MKILEEKKAKLEMQAANIIAEKIKQILSEKKYVILGVPGGKSVSGIFQNLKAKKINWSRVHIFMVDERQVPLESKDSNFKIIKQNLLNYLLSNKKMSEKNIHPYHYDKPIDDYIKEFKKYTDKFDIILLSAGEDCHVASLFPDKSIKNNEEYFIEINDSTKPPRKRISSSRKLLEKSKIALVLFFGEKKQPAYKKFLAKNTSVIECPAKLINKIEQTYIFLSPY